MKTLTAPHESALEGIHSFVDVFDITINSTTYRETNHDTDIVFNGHTYTPGMVVDISDVEITSEPKVNEITITLDGNDPTYLPLFLNGSWMNKPFKWQRITLNESGVQVGSVTVFDGLLTSFKINEKGTDLEISIASIWADFEKVAGVRTNVASQQRFYPNDTGFRHAADATKVIYWGANAPDEYAGGTYGEGGGNGRSPINPPTMPV